MENTRKIIIAGSRTFHNYAMLSSVMDELLAENAAPVEIVCGEAKGADLLGRRYATERKYEIRSFPAKWNIYGRGAGMIRNQQMINYGNELVAFWYGHSVGTRNIIQLAKEKDIPYTIVRFA